VAVSLLNPVAGRAVAATAAQLNADGQAALNRLYAQSSRATRYAKDARAILVFPKIVKVGLLIGGQGGEGVLFVQGRPATTRSTPSPTACRPAVSRSATHSS